MPRCSCAGNSCSCTMQAGLGLEMLGTGTATDPFLVSLADAFTEVEQEADGPLDLSEVPPGGFVDLTLNGNVADVTLPQFGRGKFDIYVRQGATGGSIAWPAEIKWAGGSPPVLSTTPDHGNWFSIRQVLNHWIGVPVGTEIG